MDAKYLAFEFKFLALKPDNFAFCLTQIASFDRCDLVSFPFFCLHIASVWENFGTKFFESCVTYAEFAFSVP